jgi:hypothetical protein
VTVSWQEFNPLLTFIFVVGAEPVPPAFREELPTMYSLGALMMVEQYMQTWRTVKFPKI